LLGNAGDEGDIELSWGNVGDEGDSGLSWGNVGVDADSGLLDNVADDSEL